MKLVHRRAPQAAGLPVCCLLLALALAGCQTASEEAPSVDDDLESLAAVPYLKWSEDEADALLSGVTQWERERAWDGVNLFTNDRDELYLMDMSGRLLHKWTLPPGFECEYFDLLAGGQAIAVCAGQGLVRLDRDSNVVWIYRGSVHHDVARLADGSFLTPLSAEPRPYKGLQVGFDELIHVSARGELLDRWRTWDHKEHLRRFHRASRLDRPPEKPGGKYDYYHLNTVEVLPDTPLGRRDERFRAGNLLICLRNVHLIAVLDQETREVLWSWGPRHLSFPHRPTMLPNGHILIFDNGVRHQESRVLELDPTNGEFVWEYEGDPPESFYSKRKGSAQRLPNGNTLICESGKGHVFEVTPEKERVWEFWNPVVEEGHRRLIYRFLRRPKEEVVRLFREPAAAGD